LAIPGAPALADSSYFLPNNLLVSRVIYDNNPNNVVAGVTQLPPGCAPANCVTATSSGAYPTVWNNALVDSSFGITAKIILDQLTPAGVLVNSLETPNSSQNGVPPTKDQMVGSFSSKSEVALNVSTDGQYVTFMGYLSQINVLDVSNANTPDVFDPTNPVPGAFDRVVAQVDRKGNFRFTSTNAYSGNNGRAAILNNSGGANVAYLAGNAGNGNPARLPEGRRRPGGIRKPPCRAAAIQPVGVADARAHPQQHVHLERLPDGAEEHDVVSVRSLVRRRQHALCRGRGQRPEHLRIGHVHRGRRPDHGGAPEVGVRRREMEHGLHPDQRIESWRAVHRLRLSHRQQCCDRPPMVARDRRPAQYQRADQR
jgi:hypothetical protein